MPWEMTAQWVAFEATETLWLQGLARYIWNYFEDILQAPLLLKQTVLNYLSRCKISRASISANILDLWKDSSSIFSFCLYPPSTRVFFPDSFQDVRDF